MLKEFLNERIFKKLNFLNQSWFYYEYKISTTKQNHSISKNREKFVSNFLFLEVLRSYLFFQEIFRRMKVFQARFKLQSFQHLYLKVNHTFLKVWSSHKIFVILWIEKRNNLKSFLILRFRQLEKATIPCKCDRVSFWNCPRNIFYIFISTFCFAS